MGSDEESSDVDEETLFKNIEARIIADRHKDGFPRWYSKSIKPIKPYRELIAKLLVDEEKRPSIKEVLDDPFIKRGAEEHRSESNPDLNEIEEKSRKRLAASSQTGTRSA